MAHIGVRQVAGFSACTGVRDSLLPRDLRVEDLDVGLLRAAEDDPPRPAELDLPAVVLALDEREEDTLLFAPVGALLWPVVVVRIAVAAGGLLVFRMLSPDRSAPAPASP